jgi:hypothetical protein
MPTTALAVCSMNESAVNVPLYPMQLPAAIS